MGTGQSQLVKLAVAVVLLVSAAGWMWKTYQSYRPMSPERVEQMMRAERQARREANADARAQARAEQAQVPRAPQTPEQRRQSLYRRLDLTPVQRVQAEVIRSRMEMEGEVRERDFRAALAEILTPEQRTRLEEIQRQRRQRQQASGATPEA